jgi:2-dehydro-3-deoxy-D-arabinonate dehydratase
MYDGACALGPGIVLADESELSEVPIRLSILREGEEVYAGLANSNQMKRSLHELAEHLGRETSFPDGSFLMTGTGIVPTTEFTLRPSDLVRVTVGELVLENEVDRAQ